MSFSDFFNGFYQESVFLLDVGSFSGNQLKLLAFEMGCYCVLGFSLFWFMQMSCFEPFIILWLMQMWNNFESPLAFCPQTIYYQIVTIDR